MQQFLLLLLGLSTSQPLPAIIPLINLCPPHFLSFSYDSRGGVEKPATHSAIAGDQGKRMFFALDAHRPREAHLQISEVKASDGGVYRCRVDFFNSPTKNFRVNLSLVGEYKPLRDSSAYRLICQLS